jgi:GTP-binding protein
MIDQAQIRVKAGDGGSGCNSFKGVRFTRGRHPDGGGGGKGADIIIRADNNIQSLEQFRFKRKIKAENGKQGQANKKKGADARPYIIKVPPGTLISKAGNNLLLRELIETEEEFVVVKGGAGGRGNSRERAAASGLAGEESDLLLEFKLISDAAIVGYPNCGKSTLLSSITQAKPKIAAYPFTTVVPLLGTVEFTDFEEPQILTLLEAPGLIKGSHLGKGLGIEFLRHIERTKVIVHMIDMSGQDEPWERYQSLNQELKSYNPGLLQKQKMLVANKMDGPQAIENLRDFSANLKEKIYPISALNGQGLKEMLAGLRSYFR